MINVTKTYLPNVEKYKEYIDQIFQSGWLTNNGQMVRLLEERLKDYLGVRNILLVSNGTIALQVVYKLLGLKGEVITTPFSFVATTSTLVWEGLEPVFVDIDKDTFNLDASLIEDKITERTSAILPVHVFGNPCDVERIHEIANRHSLKVIYDAAHAFGIHINDRNILEYGDVSILSFHSTKIFHTIEGGAIIINDDELYKKAKKMINFGITGPETIEELGINAKMNEVQAAMGLCMLEDIDHIMDDRQKIYEWYKDCFSNSRLKLQRIMENAKYNHSYFPIVFESEEQLLKVKEELNKNNIFPRRYFYPSLNNLYYLRQYEEMPVSTSISNKVLCLPTGYDLNKVDIEMIASIILDNVGENN